ncbi:MAG: hypothetical protein R3F31_13195 [Verrucomicrobiales bacterium]
MRNCQVDDFPNGNLHEIPEPAFERAVAVIEEQGMKVCGFGSIIANWAHKIEDDFSITEGEIARAIPRMQRLGTGILRIMSYAIRKDAEAATCPTRWRRNVSAVSAKSRNASTTPASPWSMRTRMNYGA